MITPVATLKQQHFSWLPFQSCFKTTQVPSQIKPWLVEKNSLTLKLKKAGNLSVEVLYDTWAHANRDEKSKLKLTSNQKVRVREVILKLDHKPVIFARSIIPATSLQGYWRYLNKIGSRPLGSFLYQDKRLKRGQIEIAQLPAKHYPDQLKTAWARRSVFYQYGPGILVTEIFLPDIAHYF